MLKHDGGIAFTWLTQQRLLEFNSPVWFSYSSPKYEMLSFWHEFSVWPYFDRRENGVEIAVGRWRFLADRLAKDAYRPDFDEARRVADEGEDQAD